MKTRSDLINFLIEDNIYESYLEIGTKNREDNFNKINCLQKVCVDPDPQAKADHVADSDTFFAHNSIEFDLVFVDGLHESDQVERDILNAIAHKAKCIVVHDCNPPAYENQTVPMTSGFWYGDVWRAFTGFIKTYPSTEAYCLDFDCGCGVIFPEGNETEKFVDLRTSWTSFDNNRKKLLCLRK